MTNFNQILNLFFLTHQGKLPFIGDQLTRVRLQGAKSLVAMTNNPADRFDEIGPFFCALWHTKQDFLEVTVTV